jgi:predicted aldo/keto reductase-like oxidoreductase
VDDADVDMLMFSINPAYDYHEGAYAIGSVDERSGIYRRSEAENIGITVMKPFSGGQLLNAHSSPFGVALTPYQCMKYALDKPGVLCVLSGIRSVSELDMLLDYENQILISSRERSA